MSRTCPQCANQYEDEIRHCPEDGLDLSRVEPDDELVGRTVGSYRVVRAVGKGGMGSVYLAEHPVIGSRVAIKFLHPQYSADQKIVDRFFNEARAVNVIGHDNILKILDLNVTGDGRHYFVMEFLHGKSLQDLVQRDVALPLPVTGPILLQTCEALQAAHDHKIVHRDLKPDNVYLIVHKGRKNFVKLVDFGIAKLTDESGLSTGKTQTGMVMGTPAYMSPEQAGGMTNRIDGRSDVYSLGCMMFQMATGKLPFPGTSFGEVLIGHLQVPAPPPRSLNPDVPGEYEAIILKCLAKKPEDRYQSMRELHDAIAGCMQALGISRELPVADKSDLEAAAQGPRSSPAGKSSPGARTPARAIGRPALPKRTAGRGTDSSTVAQTQLAPPPARPGKALIAGLAAGVLVLAGGFAGVVVWQQGQAEKQQEQAQKQQERQTRLAQQRAAEEARKAALARDLEAAEAAPVFLSVVSEPQGARVEATWKGGQKAGETPLDLEVPKNAKVHFAFARPGFLPYAEEVIADSPRIVKAQLAAEPRVATSTVARPPGRARRGGASKKEADPTNDSTIPVEF